MPINRDSPQVADHSLPRHQLLLSYFVAVSTCVINVKVSESPFPLHRGSSHRAPSWRATISLALSIALHAVLLTMFLLPPAPPTSPGGRRAIGCASRIECQAAHAGRKNKINKNLFHKFLFIILNPWSLGCIAADSATAMLMDGAALHRRAEPSTED